MSQEKQDECRQAPSHEAGVAEVCGEEPVLHDGPPEEKKRRDRKKLKEKKKKPTRQQMEEQAAHALEEAESYRESLVRLQAEFENFKKRQVREREEGRRSANERILREILPVLDNLERALDHGRESADVDKLLEGVTMVVKQLREGMGQFGVELIEARGQTFDPHVHEAMSRVETDGDPPDGTVVEVYQKGYLLNGRVLRPAMVGVAKIVDEKGEDM